MRLDPARSIASWGVAWIAALSLAAPMAAAQGDNVAGGAPGVVPLAAVRGEETCKLVTVEDGESAELVEERSREQGEQFPFLDPEAQEDLLEEFRVDGVRGCAIAFGIAPASGAQAAAAGAAAGAGLGATLAGAGVAAAVGSGIVLTIGGLVAVSAAAGGGGDGGGGGGGAIIPPTTTAGN